MATPTRVKFRSNLMAGFGAGFITPVNTINFETVFQNLPQKIVDSVAVWATIVAFIVIYVPFAVLARHLDKKDALKVSINFVFLYKSGGTFIEKRLRCLLFSLLYFNHLNYS